MGNQPLELQGDLDSLNCFYLNPCSSIPRPQIPGSRNVTATQGGVHFSIFQDANPLLLGSMFLCRRVIPEAVLMEFLKFASSAPRFYFSGMKVPCVFP